MRTIFVLGRPDELGEIEILHSFGNRRPTRNEVRKVFAHLPKATLLAAIPESEDERLGKVKILYAL